MSEKRYVQHRSGCGEKWPVIAGACEDNGYCVTAEDGRNPYWLPKSEFLVCAPPEPRWTNVTDACEVKQLGDKPSGHGHYGMHGDRRIATLTCQGEYRMRKLAFDRMFIIERREEGA